MRRMTGTIGKQLDRNHEQNRNALRGVVPRRRGPVAAGEGHALVCRNLMRRPLGHEDFQSPQLADDAVKLSRSDAGQFLSRLRQAGGFREELQHLRAKTDDPT